MDKPDSGVALEKLYMMEGGLGNQRYDRGGETILGISRKFWPNWDGWQYVDTAKARGYASEPLAKWPTYYLLIDDVKEFYETNFWNPIRADEYPSARVAFAVFQVAVNMGLKDAGLFLQKSLNALNRMGKTYQDIAEDGMIGRMTVAAMTSYFQNNRRSFKESQLEDILTMAILGNQYMHYQEIADRNPSQEMNFYGWVNRILATFEWVG